MIVLENFYLQNNLNIHWNAAQVSSGILDVRNIIHAQQTGLNYKETYSSTLSEEK